ncbi:MAG TPA: hypothetical protein VGO38_11845 [Acidimicrobiia bacterium]|jgi:hypothetical protein
MGTNKLWQLPVVGRLGVQHGLLVGWFLLVAVLAVLLLPGPAGSANAPGSLVEAQTATVDFGGQSHCGVVVGIGASFGGSGSGDSRCASVEAGGDAQVNTGGFGDIGMQFQNSPVGAPISNVHISNEGNNNSNNSIIGNSDLIISGNVGASANAFPPVGTAAAPVATPAAVPAAVAPPVAALPAADPGPAPAAVDLGGQSHCGVVVGVGASGGGSGSGDTRCTSVQAGGNAQVNTDGFGDIGMQFQNSPVNAPITNVHISNEGNNNSNNTVVGDNNVIINANLGITINA